MKTYTDLMESYGKFQKDKTFRNLKNLYSKAFHTDGISAWKLYRFLKNLVTGRYKKLYEKY